MRLLTTLTFALGALALATGPVKSTADQLAVHGDASVNLDDATAIEGITKRDEEASPSELDKRIGGGTVMRDIPLPHIPNPAPIIIAGVTIIFNMAARWTVVNGNLNLDYYAKSVRFTNLSARRLVVEAIANGANIFFRHMSVGRIDTGTCPENAENLRLYISPALDEL
ncbi:hypothetical protein E4U17_003546 [Claviceps sp. LM77 group G4]|nr:hypothetical protein E4U17_003546 [Claviceps sp. LM77 group G4]KAG6079317.1 hypothetical protein E4U33_000270 [Claviceps sp. LM78 group G4]KAG6085336.1 hypothetical protein E4U16_006154 [Claviceps sp. LM84 group G4]